MYLGMKTPVVNIVIYDVNQIIVSWYVLVPGSKVAG